MIQIRPVRSRRELKKFIRFPWKIYRNDSAWVPPLLSEEKKRLNRKKNPFFEHAEGEFFLAWRNGEPVGRITAHIDHLHNKTHQEKTGFFGFFESIEEDKVSAALLERAAEWLRERGMDKMRGPFSFSINEEAGTLINGFQHAPFIMTPHNPSYYPKLLEGGRLQKIKDLYCWRYDSERPVPEMAQEIATAVAEYPRLKVREIDLAHLHQDLRRIVDVFNSAWSQNWAFVPLTDREIEKTAEDVKLLVEPKLVLIAEVDGEPAGIALALPNLNEVIRDLNGRLVPFGLIKLLYRLKRKKVGSARLILLGVKPEFRKAELKGLSVLLYSEMHRRSRQLGHWGGELSWTLEDNEKINAGIQLMGGEHYKTYRIYEKTL